MSVDIEASRVREIARGLTLSVVIPVRNRPETLRRALRSVAAQTRPPNEVIVVDDASDPPVTKQGIAQDSGNLSVRVLRLSVNQGAAKARNTGVELAVGDYVAFLDSDDMWLPTYLERVAFMGGNTTSPPDVVTTGLYWCDDRLRPYRRQLPSRAATFENLADYGNFLGGCSVITVRRDTFLKLGGFPPVRGADDWNLLLDVAKVGRVDTAPEALVLYRSPSAVSSSTETMTGQYRQQILAAKMTLRRLGLHGRPSARRIRRFNAVIDLARAGRTRRCLRCAAYAVRAEGRIPPYVVRAMAYLLLGPRLRMALERRLTTLRARFYRKP